jgi:hypothetical protein
MAAYAGLAFLSFLWGSSFLLIKIASRAFDPLEFALARVASRRQRCCSRARFQARFGRDRDQECGPGL